MSDNHEQILADQRAAGRLMEEGFVPNANNVIPMRQSYQPYPSLQRPKLKLKPRSTPSSAPTGHEAYLKALEHSKAVVLFEKASSGDDVIGVIKTSDKYTVSVQTPQGTRVLFKHDISEFFVAAPKEETLQ